MQVTTLLRAPTFVFPSRPSARTAATGEGPTGTGAEPPSAAFTSQDRAPRLFGVVPGFLPPPLVLALWLAVAAAVLSIGIVVLFAGGFWARHRVLKI